MATGSNILHETEQSSAEKAREEIVEAGLTLPGIPEMLRVYGGWESAKKGLDPYHHLLKLYRPTCVATNNANTWIDDAPLGTDP